jgi:hypothetical protein
MDTCRFLKEKQPDFELTFSILICVEITIYCNSTGNEELIGIIKG